jgi:outer membrane biosynthesis protein TonB
MAEGPDTVMANPERILYADPARFVVPRKDESRPQRYVLAEFTTRADGRVESLRIAKSDARGWMLEQTKRALLEARYRPAFAAGKPVLTTGIRCQQSFE